MFYTIKKWIHFICHRYILKVASNEEQRQEVIKYKNLISCYESNSVWILDAEEFHESVLHSKHKNKILECADNIIQNRIPILSSKYYELGLDIKWDFDYEKGLQFSNLYDAKKKGCDIKKAWELSRMHQLLPLVKAYYLTEDNKYIDKLYQLTDDWAIKNPPFVGVNWSNPMETAIRCVNVINIIKLLPQLKENKPWIERINHNLLCSGIYIWNNFENKTLVNNNHYLSDLVGLIYISVYFQDTTVECFRALAQKWLNYSIKELKSELKHQILPDGGSFELSSSYHAYVLELVYYTYLLLKMNNIYGYIFLKDYVKKMSAFLKGISIDGKISLIGDNDNSHLFRFSDLYPFEDCNNYNKLITSCEQETGANVNIKESFADFGLYKLQKEHLKVLIKCGALTKATGHSHNDQLGYVLWYKGNQIVADPGTYCYTSDIKTRNMFRGTGYHSVVQMDDVEQNKFKKCFSLVDLCHSKCTEISDSRFSGFHSGYSKSHNAKVYRMIEIDYNLCVVKDVIGHNSGISRITLSPDVKQVGDNCFILGDISFVLKTEMPFNVRTINFSPSYGLITSALQIEIPFSESVTYKIIFR